MNFSTLFDQDDVKQLLTQFRTILRAHHSNTNIVMQSLYAQKIRVKQILEILFQAQTANQKCSEIQEVLQRKQIELRCSLAGTEFQYTSPINLTGLINDGLNIFELCYGMPLDATLPIRNILRKQVAPDLIEEWVNDEITDTRALSFDQKQVLINAISETLSLWKTCQSLFSWHAVSHLTTYSVADIVIGSDVPITLPTLILTARAIDNLKKSIRQEEAQAVLCSLPNPEAGWRIFKYAFVDIQSHFDHLFDEYCGIHARYFGAFPYAPVGSPPQPMPSTSTPVENATPPLTWAEVAKRPISESNKDLLSLYAKSFQNNLTRTHQQHHSQEKSKKNSPPSRVPKHKNPTTVLIDGVEKIFLRRDTVVKPEHRPPTQNLPSRSNRFTYLTSEEEIDKQVSPETENEAAAATAPSLPRKIAKLKKGRKPAQTHASSQKSKDKEDFLLLEQSIESNKGTQTALSEIENTAQLFHQEEAASYLIKQVNDFLSGHDRGRKGKEIRIEFVIKDLQESESLLAKIETCYQSENQKTNKTGNKRRVLLTLKKEIEQFRKGILEGAIPQFLQDYKQKTIVEVSLDALYKNWEIFLDFIEALNNIGKLGDYIKDRQTYFDPLLDSLSELEKKYYVAHRVKLGSNPGDEVLFRYLRARSALFISLYNIQLMCLNQLQLDEMGCSTIVAALDDIQKNVGRIASKDLTLFFKQLMPKEQHQKIPRYIKVWRAYAEEEGYSIAMQLLSEKTNRDPLLFSHQATSTQFAPPLTAAPQEEEEPIERQQQTFKLR